MRKKKEDTIDGGNTQANDIGNTVVKSDGEISLPVDLDVEHIGDVAEKSGIAPVRKKCLILCMCCNDELYQKEYDDIMLTWGRMIVDGHAHCLDIWGYTASDNGKYEIDVTRRMLRVPVFDTLDYTYLKTEKVLNALGMFGIEYDWILRTNCSTTINVRMMERMMEGDVLDRRHIYVSDLVLNPYKSAPYSHSPLTKGQFILFHKDYAMLVNGAGFEVAESVCDFGRYVHRDVFRVDDMTLMAIFNTYIALNGRDVRDVYRVMPTQYMSDIMTYGVPLNPFSVALFNKNNGESRPLKNYYYDMRDRYVDFYTKRYGELGDDLDACRDYVLSHLSFSIIKIENGVENTYNVPFGCYMTDEMFRIMHS